MKLLVGIPSTVHCPDSDLDLLDGDGRQVQVLGIRCLPGSLTA
jgi:hypothetical protein